MASPPPRLASPISRMITSCINQKVHACWGSPTEREKENRTRSDGHGVAATCPNRGRIEILPPSRRDFSGQSRSISQPRGPAPGPDSVVGEGHQDRLLVL